MLKNAGNEASVKEISIKGQKIFQELENSQKPFVAAIHGVALGGGLEVGFKTFGVFGSVHKPGYFSKILFLIQTSILVKYILI